MGAAMNWGRRLAYILSLAATIILAALAPREAAAQLGGSLVVTMTAPSNGANVSGTIPVRASVTMIGGLTVQGVQFKLDGADLGAFDTAAPYAINWDTKTASNGSHTLTAVARDVLGVQWSSNPISVTVFNDTTAPSVSVTSPGDGATVSGAITLTANASDNVGVVGVQFQVDGNNNGPEATATPYAAPWNTINATNGSHTITAIARDAAGNRTTSSAVTVTVMNDTTPPSVSISSPAAGATVSGTAMVVASASDNIAVAGVQFKLDGGNLGAEVTTAPYQTAWDTTTAHNGAHTLSAVARDAAGNTSTAVAVSVTVNNLSPVAIENQQPGADNWGMWFGGMPADDVGRQIKGYASATSVNKGDSITFYVSVATAQTYTIDIYRMGYYQGHGGRLMQSIGSIAGTPQPPCPADVNTGLIECNWTAGYTLQVPSSWVSGIFLAKLTSAAGFQNWIIFVVRDDARQADLVYQQPTNTYQAYNNYPNDNATGKSIYDFNSFGAPTASGTARAVKVSFNRPYADRGAGQFFNWEYYFIRWLERSGYDVKYVSTLDTHERGVPATRGFLSIAHDEYWSKDMYDAAEAARAAGVNMAFFGGNGVYWQVRFEASPLTGVADRVMVGYKDRTKDPVQGPTTTIQWRDPFINRPEQTLMGVMFNGQIDFSGPNAPFVVQNSSHWVYAGTGVHDGDQIPGIIGYEMDGSWANVQQPDAIAGTAVVLGASPYTDSGSGASLVSNATIYQAPSGAWVFAAGTTSWAWGLDLDGTADARLQGMTANILDRFVGKTN
ncbi:MAG TPA: N,N-dimethylformamidase beta subunit family domain-containing protein [Burkholderiales bacterium]|nr:N,N-dimethylformamidase beta subunit family domain-containing protein [Burkholderiales bacterium]